MARLMQSMPIIIYFFLSVFITLTNKWILGTFSSGGATQRPYLLTAAHGSASFIGCLFIDNNSKHVQSTNNTERLRLKWRQHIYLAVFSLFYTVNIALSNLSLALVDLSLNQTIRATAPVLTVLVSVLILRRPLESYSISTRLSLIPITAGVIFAVTSKTTSSDILNERIEPYRSFESSHQLYIVGIMITFLGSLTAVFKTVATHKLMTSLSLNLTPSSLLRTISPYAILQACIFAYANGELRNISLFEPSNALYDSVSNHTTQFSRKKLNFTISHLQETHYTIYASTLTLWMSNATAAFLLNLASFEANRVSGPVSMAVVGNLKQVVILIVSLTLSSMGNAATNDINSTARIVVGTTLTVVGGMWYAWAMSKSRTEETAAQQARNRYRHRPSGVLGRTGKQA